MSSANETCPLCPPSGPPIHPKSSITAIRPQASIDNAHPSSDGGKNTEAIPQADVEAIDDEDEDDTVLSWIYCPKCTEWYHGVCILSHSEESKNTIPEMVRNHLDQTEDGIWTDWTKWVDKWYCQKCIAESIDPDNPRPPRYPLNATIDKKTFPPRPPVQKAPKAPKRISNVNGDEGLARAKKRKTGRDSTNGASESPVPVSRPLGSAYHEESKGVNGTFNSFDQANDTIRAASEITSSINEVAMKEETSEDASGIRPKRQVALHRPDYHALHHHIATPTARWLDLINDPEKYGTKISTGNFPRIPAKMLRREWLDAPLPSATAGPSSVKLENDASASPSHTNGDSLPYPPHLPPDLYYGPRREPLIIKPEDGGFEGMGGRIPGKGFSVGDVARLVGPDRLVDVIDVATQQSSQWSLQKWADYVAARFGSNANTVPGSDPSSSKVYNVISLEISGTQLADMVKPPTIVSEIDWVDNCWNFGPGGKELAVREDMAVARGEKAEGDKPKAKGKAREPWPKVQLYCLMGAKGSWTDWHVDFAASSVYYTIHTGAKTFFFIRPTQKNLAAYAEWSGSYEKQQTVWLGDMCDEVRKVELKQGDTMMLPAGYIHAVYTPEDSIVFGGNFLHSYDIPTQLRLRQIEIDTKVPQRFRFPFFDKLCWYVAEKHCAQLRALRLYKPKADPSTVKSFSSRVLRGLLALSDFLIGQCDIMENSNTEEKRRKLIHDRIPAKIDDAPALARELKWRVQRELPEDESREELEKGSAVKDGNKEKVKKRPAPILPPKGKSRTWNFTPLPWKESATPTEHFSRMVHLPKGLLADSRIESANGIADSDQAEESVTVRRQSRQRKRALDDGTIIFEEQEYVATERKIVWEPIKKDQGIDLVSSVSSEVPGEGMCID